MEVTQKELASCLGITARQVRNLKENGMFVLPQGAKKYDLAKCVREYIDFKVEDATGRGAAISKEKVSVEHESIKKQISELKLKKLKREVHMADDVAAFLTNMLIGFRSELLLLPPKLAITVIGEKDVNAVIRLIEKEVNRVLEKLSDYDPDTIDGMSHEEDGFDDEEDEDEE